MRTTECLIYFLYLRRDRIYFKLFYDNYFWRENNRNINLIVRNVGCKKGKEVRQGQKWKPTTWGIPRRSPNQLRTPPDRV